MNVNFYFGVNEIIWIVVDINFNISFDVIFNVSVDVILNVSVDVIFKVSVNFYFYILNDVKVDDHLMVVEIII